MTGHVKIITDSYEYESHNKILNSSKTIMALVLSNKFKISHLLVGNGGNEKLYNETTYKLGNKTYQFVIPNINVDENSISIEYEDINKSNNIINEFALATEFNNEMILFNYGFLNKNVIGRNESFKLTWKINF